MPGAGIGNGLYALSLQRLERDRLASFVIIRPSAIPPIPRRCVELVVCAGLVTGSCFVLASSPFEMLLAYWNGVEEAEKKEHVKADLGSDAADLEAQTLVLALPPAGDLWDGGPPAQDWHEKTSHGSEDLPAIDPWLARSVPLPASNVEFRDRFNGLLRSVQRDANIDCGGFETAVPPPVLGLILERAP